MEDTFGRLPTDVITMIKEIYQLPTIDVDGKHDEGYLLIIKYPYATHHINIGSRMWKRHPDFNQMITNKIKTLHEFIQKLKNNVSCAYYEGVTITYNNDITLKASNHTMILPKDCIVSFIIAMDKYYDMLTELT
jgi:hypothetical protein